MGERGHRNWWVSGCLILVALVVLVVGTVAVLTWLSVRGADRRTATRVHEPSTASGPATDPIAEIPAGDGNSLRVLLELDSCEVYVEPAAPGEPFSVEAHYDANDYRIEEIASPENPGSYHLRFLVDSSRLITGIKQGLRGGQPQLRIRLPLDTPIDFKLLQRNGGAIVDFSGLNLEKVEFDVGGALLKVDADDRLTGDLERLVVHGSEGGVILESLNLLDPREIDIDFRMGQMTLDFRGSWASDTDVGLSMGMVDTVVRLPREARVEGIGEGRLSVSPARELQPPTLSFTVETGRRAKLRVFE